MCWSIMVLATLFVCVGCSKTGRWTDADQTLRTINVTSVAIGHYYRQHQCLPADLKALNLSEPCLDGWGNPIQYTIIDDNTYRLKSHGKKGRPDGAAISCIFDAGDITTESSRRIK